MEVGLWVGGPHFFRGQVEPGPVLGGGDPFEVDELKQGAPKRSISESLPRRGP